MSIYIYIAEPLCCTAEANMTLQTSYTSGKKNTFTNSKYCCKITAHSYGFFRHCVYLYLPLCKIVKTQKCMGESISEEEGRIRFGEGRTDRGGL